MKPKSKKASEIKESQLTGITQNSPKGTCPHCGRCPTCGQPYPTWNFPQNPQWQKYQVTC